MGGHAEDGQRYVSLAGLRVRGWTGGMVHRLLGAADRLSVNPRFRDAPRVRLYRLDRVEAAERSDEFRAVAESSGRRSEAVRAAMRRRREDVLERIRNEPIDVPRLDPGTLALRAVEHRARREAEWGRTGGDGRIVNGPVDRSSLDPWKVDYLRHRLRHYDQLLETLPGHGRSSGRSEAATLLRERICAAIAEAYPPLAQECERQARDQGVGPPLQ
ncbi:hypothetical protein [Streptomyces sp. DSM 40750]|uniref:hypothetical protein n=1 Tax=Streptomyces sp. DSM 40750 TaxID=2801030 RepID=UPI00214CF670|nr:hypothetical protein [Streptomyces sp. DSM 40750]UUU21245.1 hypothetical protein JIX55_13535 [Streptomyces sp. DSM 40750]